jgi:hypothetical protein
MENDGIRRVGILHKEHMKWKEFQRYERIHSPFYELVTPIQTRDVIFMPEIVKGLYPHFGKMQEREGKLNI